MQQDKIGIQIKRIKTLSFSINEHLAKIGIPYKIEFGNSISTQPEFDLLFFVLRVFYFYPTEDGKTNELLVDLSVQNIFQVHNLKIYMFENVKIGLPPDVWINIIGLSVGHMRAILAQLTAGTILQDSLIPIMDAADMAKKFFPDNFESFANKPGVPG